MDPYGDYLSKMMPEFEKKPATAASRPLVAQVPATKKNEAVVDAGPAREKASQPENVAHELFDSIAAHISQYLCCGQHQLTVLTLWVAHTWSVKTGRTAAYLNICSPESQCGKSICLMLLRDLVQNPSFATGASPDALMRYLLTNATLVDDNKFQSTLLLDDYHHTFGPSERQPILALLNTGSDAAPCYFASPHEYYVFGPKAFAGNSPLPRSLASRCIPVCLSRKKPLDPVSRFDPEVVRQAAAKLVSELTPWINRNRDALERAAKETPARFPLGFTPREQGCAEPLVNLADLVGGSWPQKARDAVNAIFKAAEGSMAVELLCDLRGLFYSKGDPEYLPTKEILSALRELEHRPWNSWSRNSGRKLGALLHPFGVHSRSMRHDSSPTFRGYLFEHFQDVWDRYMPPITTCSATKNPSATGSATNISSPCNDLRRIAESPSG